VDESGVEMGLAMDGDGMGSVMNHLIFDQKAASEPDGR
jgi:hypothetical protein